MSILGPIALIHHALDCAMELKDSVDEDPVALFEGARRALAGVGIPVVARLAYFTTPSVEGEVKDFADEMSLVALTWAPALPASKPKGWKAPLGPGQAKGWQALAQLENPTLTKAIGEPNTTLLRQRQAFEATVKVRAQMSANFKDKVSQIARRVGSELQHLMLNTEQIVAPKCGRRL